MKKLVFHCYEPVYNESSRVLLLGTMPSPASREQGFYYSHKRNRFWQVLSAITALPLANTPEEKRALLLQSRIALWDVLQSCEIEGASDSSITSPQVNDIRPILQSCNIAAIFTTGTKAYQLYRRHIMPVCQREAVPLPSTSPANAKMSLDELIEQYSVIRQYLN